MNMRWLGLTVLCALTTAGCEKAQLLAPTNSTITLSAPTRLLPSNGSTEVTAVVMEQAGTPVQNGTVVRFTTSLGRVDPIEVQTRNGIAITTFFAGATSGVAEIRGISGGATGGTTGTGSNSTAGTSNVIQITVGTAAVKAVSVRANPGSVSPTGSSVELIASVVATDGSALPGVLVTFNSTQGTLSSSTALTNANGEARTTLTSANEARVSATAGLVTSSDVTVTVRSSPALTITCAPASGTGNCAAVATSSNNTATVVFTVTRPTGSSAFRTATIDFGDGTSQSLGTLAGGSATVTHTYSGPSSEGSTRTYTATVQATDVNGESSAASTTVNISRAARTPVNVNVTSTCGTGSLTSGGVRCTFDANATGGGEGGTGNAVIESYTWDFGDSSDDVVTSGDETAHVYTRNGTYTVQVTARTADGRSATGRTEVLISGLPQ